MDIIELLDKIDAAKPYFMGCSGITEPVDIEGNIIREGDILTYDYGDSVNQKPWMFSPTYVVVKHKSGKGLCAIGVSKDLYLHDFRFKNCKKISED